MEDIFIENLNEFQKQKEEYIINSGEYIGAKFLVGSGDDMPISVLKGTKVNEEDIARLICAMRSQINFLLKKCPEADIIAQNMISQSYNSIQNYETEEEENEDE